MFAFPESRSGYSGARNPRRLQDPTRLTPQGERIIRQPELQDLILPHCDRPTLTAVMCTCRDLYLAALRIRGQQNHPLMRLMPFLDVHLKRRLRGPALQQYPVAFQRLRALELLANTFEGDRAIEVVNDGEAPYFTTVRAGNSRDDHIAIIYSALPQLVSSRPWAPSGYGLKANVAFLSRKMINDHNRTPPLPPYTLETYATAQIVERTLNSICQSRQSVPRSILFHFLPHAPTEVARLDGLIWVAEVGTMFLDYSIDLKEIIIDFGTLSGVRGAEGSAARMMTDFCLGFGPHWIMHALLHARYLNITVYGVELGAGIVPTQPSRPYPPGRLRDLRHCLGLEDDQPVDCQQIFHRTLARAWDDWWPRYSKSIRIPSAASVKARLQLRPRSELNAAPYRFAHLVIQQPA